MKRTYFPFAAFLAASLSLGACSAPTGVADATSSSGRHAMGSSRSLDVIAVDPVRYAARYPEPTQAVSDLLRALRAEGGSAELSVDTVAPLMLPRPGKVIIVNGERLAVFEYRSLSETRQAARSISREEPNGSGAGRYYRMGLLLVRYAGNAPAVLGLLDRIMDESIE